MITYQKVLNKNEIINSTYEVQFFIGGDTFYEKYRVKGRDGKTYLLKLYNSSKLPFVQWLVTEKFIPKKLMIMKLDSLIFYVQSLNCMMKQYLTGLVN